MANKYWPEDWAPKPNISHSSMNTFKDCPWKYFIGGAPPDLKKLVPPRQALENQLGPWAGYAGSIVDETIREILQYFMANGEWPPDDEIESRAVDLLRKSWTDGVAWKKARERGAKPVFGEPGCVDRVFYEEMNIPTEERLAVKETVKTCIRNWLQSDIRELITGYPIETWRMTKPISQQPMPWFWSDHVPVYASYDFAIVDDDQTIIFDWKCGKRNDWSMDSLKRQLHAYAEFAVRGPWKSKLENTLLYGVWLNPYCLDEVLLDVDFLGQLRSEWKDQHAVLSGKLNAIEQAGPCLQVIQEHFPMAGAERTCRNCSIHSCQRWHEVNGGKP